MKTGREEVKKRRVVAVHGEGVDRDWRMPFELWRE